MTPAAGITRAQYFQTEPLVPDGPGELRLDMANGEYILFRRVGTYDSLDQSRFAMPVEHGLPSGYKRYFDYTGAEDRPWRIRDNYGRQMTLTWAATNAPGAVGSSTHLIEAIALPDGTSLSYTYDKGTTWSVPWNGSAVVRDRLISARRLSSTGTVLWGRTYHYEDAARKYALTGSSDHLGNRLSTYAYDSGGRATLSERAGGVNRHSVTYTEDGYAHEHANVTNPLGRVTRFTFVRDPAENAFVANALRFIDGQATSSVPADNAQVDMAANLVTATIDAKGNRTTIANDGAAGRPTSITEAEGTPTARTTTMAWHPVFDLPASESRPGLTVSYVYDTQGRLTSRTETDTTAHTVPYSTQGQARTTTYGWTPQGKIASVNGPKAAVGALDDVTSYVYDAAGNLTSMTNALGHITSFAGHDGNGNPATMTDPNNAVTAFTYDALGRVLTINRKHPTTATNDAITTLEYDIEGRVIGLTAPVTDKLIMDYDLAGRLTAMRVASGERIDFTYDANSGLTSQIVKRANGTTARSVSRTFDSIGRLLTETLGPGRTRSYAYDKNGNPVSATSARNFIGTSAFDGLDRLVSTLAPDAGTTANAYDARDNLITHTDAAAVATQFVRNGFGEIVQETSPDRGVSIYRYDAAGDMIEATDGRGQRVDYVRDMLGRVLTKTPAGLIAQRITYSYDASGLGTFQKGRLTRIVDPTGTMLFNWDHRGNMTQKRQKIGTTTAANLTYAYDLADHVTQMSYPSGRIVGYVRDSKRRVITVRTRASSAIATWTNLATTVQYEALGSMKSLNYGNTLSLTQSWGNDGRLAEKRVYRTTGGVNLSRLTYSYDNDDNMIAINDLVDANKSASYGYDAMDRLVRADVASGALRRTDWVHDANGNRTAVERRALPTDAAPAETESYTTTSGTNRLASIVGPLGPRSIFYDGRGNSSTETRGASVNVSTAYDGFGRLTSYARTGEATQAHSYNGFDERVATTTGTTARQFLHDPMGRAMGEYGASAAAAEVKAEFIWLDPDTNNGVFGGDDGINGYALLAVAVPDAALPGTTKLSWVHTSHIGVPLLHTDTTGTSVPPAAYRAPGFPGQHQTHADLYDNKHRDYDPTTGRYIQADPIGLDGDANPYAYARGNPLRYTDPTGQFVPIVAGALWGYRAATTFTTVTALYFAYETFTTPAFYRPGCNPMAGPGDKKRRDWTIVDTYVTSDVDGGGPPDCHDYWEKDKARCRREYGSDPDQLRTCLDWVKERYLDCLKGRPDRGPFSDELLDGFKQPQPPKAPRRRRGGFYG